MNGWSSVAAFLWDGGGNARPPAAVAAMLFVPASAFVLAALRGDFATAQTVEQDRAEIGYLLEVLSLSKADAQRLLSMPRQAWEKNVAHAVIAGTAQRAGGKPSSPASPIMLGLYTPTRDGFVLRPKLPEPIGMLTKTPEGFVIRAIPGPRGFGARAVARVHSRPASTRSVSISIRGRLLRGPPAGRSKEVDR